MESDEDYDYEDDENNHDNYLYEVGYDAVEESQAQAGMYGLYESDSEKSTENDVAVKPPTPILPSSLPLPPNPPRLPTPPLPPTPSLPPTPPLPPKPPRLPTPPLPPNPPRLPTPPIPPTLHYDCAMEQNNVHVVASASSTQGFVPPALPEDDPELMYESPAKDLLSTPPSSPPSTISLFNKLVTKVPFLMIPQYFGLLRCTKCIPLTMDGEAEEASQQVVYQTEDGNIVLSSMEEVHAFLLEKDLPLPMACFTFESGINPHNKFSRDYWRHITAKEDLSEGKESTAIPVICHKSRLQSLAKYVTECRPAEDLQLSLQHDDDFFSCCDCPNDCEDKLNCPCFQKTLENCSMSTRQEVGDEGVGYHFQRLDRPFLSGIFECNRMCKCRKDTCVNRVVQNGIRCSLQLFMTERKGWGVRTLCDVPKGSYICTYAGKIVNSEFADKVSANWDGGKWKYLSELQVGEIVKDGYEAEAVEPVDEKGQNLEESSLEGEEEENGENNRLCEVEEAGDSITTEEWAEFLHHDNASPEELQQAPEAPSPSPSCLGTPSVSLRDGNENKKEPQPSTRPIAFKRLKSASDSVPRDRALRISDRLFAEHPEDFELLPTGRSGFIKRTMKETEELSHWNKISKRDTECRLLPTKQVRNRRKFTEYMHLHEYDARRNDRVEKLQEELRRKKEKHNNIKEQEKRKERLAQSSRITRQFVDDYVLKSLTPGHDKAKGSDGGSALRDMAKIARRCVSKACHQVRGRKKLTSRMSIKKKGSKRRRSKLNLYKQRKSNGPSAPELHPLLNFNFNIDGIEEGNIGRYLNHSCDPNLFPQYVFTNSHDLRLPGIAFFASRNILAGEELTWDYKYDHEDCDENEESDKHTDQQPAKDHVQEQQPQQQADNDDNAELAGGNGSEIKEITNSSSTKPADTRKRIRRRAGSGSSSTKRTLTRLLCHCGADNCSHRIC